MSTNTMNTATTHVLFVGLLPETVDYSDPALPPGLNAEKIQAGIDRGMQLMQDRGWQADLCLVSPDVSAAVDVRQRLSQRDYDCVVIGGGIRIPPSTLSLFETLVNVVHATAPRAAIAFNTIPQDTADSAARALAI